jgi:hypothetical protein
VGDMGETGEERYESNDGYDPSSTFLGDFNPVDILLLLLLLLFEFNIL